MSRHFKFVAEVVILSIEDMGSVLDTVVSAAVGVRCIIQGSTYKGGKGKASRVAKIIQVSHPE